MMLCLMSEVAMQEMTPLALEVFYKVERAMMYKACMQGSHAVCGCIVDKAAGRAA